MNTLKKWQWYVLGVMTLGNVISCFSILLLFILWDPVPKTDSNIYLLILEILLIISGLSVVLLLLFLSMLFYSATETGVLERLRHKLLSIRPRFIRHLLEFAATSGKHISLGIVAVLAFLAFSIFCLYQWNLKFGDPNPYLVVLKSPGVIFILVMALVTITGFVLTIKKVAENNSLITNYQQLLDTAKKILEKAAEEENASIKMICVTPCHGNYSENGTIAYDNYYKLIKDIRDRKIEMKNSYLDLICYDVDDWSEDPNTKSPLQKFYENYQDDSLKKKAFNQAKSFIKGMKKQIEKDDEDEEFLAQTHLYTPVEESLKFPSYRLLITNKAAICYFPIDISYTHAKTTERLKRVEMLGFTTKVGYIVDWLHKHFDHIKHEIDSPK